MRTMITLFFSLLISLLSCGGGEVRAEDIDCPNADQLLLDYMEFKRSVVFNTLQRPVILVTLCDSRNNDERRRVSALSVRMITFMAQEIIRDPFGWGDGPGRYGEHVVTSDHNASPDEQGMDIYARFSGYRSMGVVVEMVIGILEAAKRISPDEHVSSRLEALLEEIKSLSINNENEARNVLPQMGNMIRQYGF